VQVPRLQNAHYLMTWVVFHTARDCLDKAAEPGSHQFTSLANNHRCCLS